MVKRSGLGLILFLVAGFSAHAQIAIPEIASGAPRVFNARFPIAVESSITPLNPAALQWGSPSRIGAGVLIGSSNHAAPDLSGDIEGSFAGFRLIGSVLALAADTVEYDLTSLSNSPIEEKATTISLSFTHPDYLAWGFAVGTLERSVVDGPGNRTDIEIESNIFGLSWMISESWFLGVAAGKEDATTIFPFPPSVLERDVNMAGFGFRTRGGIIWHMEVSWVKKGIFKDQFGGLTNGYELKQGMVEVSFWNMLLGYTGYTVEGAGDTLDQTVSGSTIDFGIFPFSALSISGRFEQSTNETSLGIFAIDKISSLFITLQF